MPNPNFLHDLNSSQRRRRDSSTAPTPFLSQRKGRPIYTAGMLMTQPGDRPRKLTIRVHPRAGRSAAQWGMDGAIEVWTTAPPAEGRANEAVIRLVAELLDVPLSRLQITAGAHGRTKTIEMLPAP